MVITGLGIAAGGFIIYLLSVQAMFKHKQQTLSPFPIFLSAADTNQGIVVSTDTSPLEIENAVAASFGIPPGNNIDFVDSHGKSFRRYGKSILRPSGHYSLVHFVKAAESTGPACIQETHISASRPEQEQGNPQSAHLPRVAIATVATGINRAAGITALMSAYKHFGGDCVVSFHMLTDDTADIAAVLNPTMIIQHSRSVGDRLVYKDLLEQLGNTSAITRTDYFFYLDPNAQFERSTYLQDVAGDLVGVEHAFYPRDHSGLCQPRRTDGRIQSVHNQVCEFPYIRDKGSNAYMPATIGKFWHKGRKKHHDGRNQIHLVVNSTYYNHLFWGGRTKFVTDFIAKLTIGVLKDLGNGPPAATSEMYDTLLTTFVKCPAKKIHLFSSDQVL